MWTDPRGGGQKAPGLLLGGGGGGFQRVTHTHLADAASRGGGGARWAGERDGYPVIWTFLRGPPAQIRAMLNNPRGSSLPAGKKAAGWKKAAGCKKAAEWEKALVGLWAKSRTFESCTGPWPSSRLARLGLDRFSLFFFFFFCGETEIVDPNKLRIWCPIFFDKKIIDMSADDEKLVPQRKPKYAIRNYYRFL